MPVKSLIIMLALSFGLSACSMFSPDEAETMPAKATKTAAKSAHAEDAAKCSADGFCSLPLLKAKK